MGRRDEEGFVSWPCNKCGVVFKRTCGQLFWEIGTIKPPWPEEKVSGIVKNVEDSKIIC